MNTVRHSMYMLCLQMRFQNEASGEFVFYELSIKATKPGVFGRIELTTPVRQSIPHTVQIMNPLANAVNFQASCNVPEMLMPPNLPCPADSLVSGPPNLPCPANSRLVTPAQLALHRGLNGK